MAEGGTENIGVYLGGDEENPAAADSVFESESETEDGNSEAPSRTTASTDPRMEGDRSGDVEDGCFSFKVFNGIKVITDRLRRKSKKSDISRSYSGQSSASGSTSSSVFGSEADLNSVRGSVSSNVPGYYDTEEYFFGYPNRGYAIIINNEKFEPGSDFDDRGGSSSDERKLKEVFKKLGFRLKVYRNLRGDQIVDRMEKMAERDHSDKDCFVCAILTHGGEQNFSNGKGVKVHYDIIFGTDGRGVTTRYLLEIFSDDNSPTLVGKPRLFFIQACRGEKYDLGKTVSVYENRPPSASRMPSCGAGDAADSPGDDSDDGEGSVSLEISTPLHRDFLVAYATPPGYYAWRRDSGSWFVTCLHRTVMNRDGEETLLQLLTRTAWEQGLGFASETRNPETDQIDEEKSGKKAVPHVTSMLTKDVYFRPKSRPSQ